MGAGLPDGTGLTGHVYFLCMACEQFAAIGFAGIAAGTVLADHSLEDSVGGRSGDASMSGGAAAFHEVHR